MHPLPVGPMPVGPGAGPAPWCRVTVLAPRGRVDVALPADVPVGELVPMLLELVGEPRRAVPGAARSWRLSGVSGGPLPPGATLDELGVLDGELLRVAPDAPPPPPPVFDDPVDAVAHGAATGTRPVAPVPGRGALALLGGGAALLAWAGSGPDGGWTIVTAVLALLGTVGALAASAVAARAPVGGARAPVGGARTPAGGTGPARTAALAAVPLAAAAGWCAVPGGPLSARLLMATAAAGTAGALGLVALRAAQPVLVAVVVGAVPVGVAAAVHLRLGTAPAGLGAALGALAMVAGPTLPRIALRLSGLPLPVIPADAGELAAAEGAGTAGAELVARAALARGLLAGLLAGVSVPAALAAPVVAAGGGWAAPVLAVLVVAVLGLRARGYSDPGPRRTLLLSAGVGGTAMAAVLSSAAGPGGRVAIAVAVLLVAAGVATVERGGGAPFGSPVARRAVDIVEGVLVALSVPLALGVLGVYELVRGL